jgi:hypothetical protein
MGLRRKSFFYNFGNTKRQPIGATNSCTSLLYNEDTSFKHYKFKEKSSWNPLGPATLEAFALANELDLASVEHCKPKSHNINGDQRSALLSLKNNKEIVIKAADKGSAVVIQNTTDYISEGLRQLSDDKYYKKLDDDLSPIHAAKISRILDVMFLRGEIHRSVLKYLKPTTWRTSRFYMLPKIHKPTRPPPGRPIISGNGCPTERISQFVDHFLKPCVLNVKSYLKDTTHLLNLLREVGTLPPNSIIFTMDVTSLYTNINNDEAITACAEALDLNRPGETEPSNISLLKLLECVLKMNNFEFNGQHYLQVGGTAMGTKLAPSLANIFMGNFEEKYVYTYHLQPLLWKRFIDDILGIWTYSLKSLLDFFDHLNSCHNSIKFTVEHSTTSTNFLDCTIKIEDNLSISTCLYTKPTDTFAYLRYNSAHPQSCKDGIPYSQFLSVRKICSSISDFDTQVLPLAKSLKHRGYPCALIENALIKARQVNRDEILDMEEKQQQEDNKVFLITTFQPEYKPPVQTIRSNWDLLGKSNVTTHLYNLQVIGGYRRPQNMKDILMNAKISYHPELLRPKEKRKKIWPKRCRNTKCIYCPCIDTSGEIKSTANGRTFMAMKTVTCKSHILIYCITCKFCNMQYVGLTKNKIQERFKGHFTSITSNDDQHPIGRHFNLPGHSGLRDVKIQVLAWIKHPSETEKAKRQRKYLEHKWMFKMKTTLPFGLNTMDTLFEP